MDKSVEFEMEFTVSKGRGYVPAEENEREDERDSSEMRKVIK